jgi:hypothetical protein
MLARFVAYSARCRSRRVTAAGILVAALSSCATAGGDGTAPRRQIAAAASPHVEHTDASDDESGEEKARDAFDSKQFLTALHLAPKQYPLLTGLDAPRLAAGELLSDKSGPAGLGRIDQIGTVIAGSITHGEDVFGIRTKFLSLFSGPPVAGQAVGSSDARLFSPTTRLALGIEPTVSWFREGAVMPYAEFGATPAGGVLPPTIAARGGAVIQFDDSQASGQLYRRPITESILSYTGITDPGTGRSFGRVTETGAKVDGSLQVTKGFSAEPSVSYGLRGGVAVADNPHFSAELELPYAVKVSNFDSFTVGPGYYFEHFDRNESEFTIRSGGYYSPQSYHRVGVTWNFQTAEMRDFVITGWITPGWQWSRENEVVVFPFGDARLVPRAKESAPDFEGLISAAYRLAANWSLGGVVHGEQSPQFRQVSAFVSLRYSFAPRGALVSRDIWLSPSRHF